MVESIKHLSDQEQAEKIADKFSKVSQEYEALKTEDIKLKFLSLILQPFHASHQIKSENI